MNPTVPARCIFATLLDENADVRSAQLAALAKIDRTDTSTT